MKQLQCIITDDEPIARQILENYIKEIPNLELIASCKNAFEVIEVLQTKAADILFLDINMPKMSGLSLLKSLQQKPEVIITTAYPEHAVEGFELSVTDYLLKPFSLERFFQAIQKVKNNVLAYPEISPSINQKISQAIIVKSDKKIIKVNVDDIFYVEAYGNYIKIFSDKMILTQQTLTEFLKKLPETFIRIHKSFVVNFDKLKLIDGNQFVLQNETKLPIGKSYRKMVIDKINQI